SLISSPEALQDGKAEAAQDAHVTRLRAGLEVELDVAVQRRHPDGGAERRLRKRQIDRAVDVVSLTDEALVRLDVHLDVHVAGAAAEHAGVPFAAEPNPLPVVDSGRNVDLQGACLQHAAGAVALFARMVDRSTRAAAGRAGLRADELAEDAARDLSQPAAAAARLAGADLGSGLGAATAAATAADRD